MMISPILRPLAVSGSPAAEWPLAGSPCPRVVGLQSVGYAWATAEAVQGQPPNTTSWMNRDVTERSVCSGLRLVQSKTNIWSPQTPSLRSNFAVSHLVGMFVERTVEQSRDVGELARCAASWELCSLSKHLTSTNNFTKCCRGTISWRYERCLWTSDGVVNGIRRVRHCNWTWNFHVPCFGSRWSIDQTIKPGLFEPFTTEYSSVCIQCFRSLPKGV